MSRSASLILLLKYRPSDPSWYGSFLGRTPLKRTLILGGGFGGLAVATELRRLLGKDDDILLIDRREHFLAGLRKLWALVGLGTLEKGQRSRGALSTRGLTFLQHDVRQIDLANRRVVTDEGTYDGDYLVVALGAEPRPDLVPGLAEHAHGIQERTARRYRGTRPRAREVRIRSRGALGARDREHPAHCSLSP